MATMMIYIRIKVAKKPTSAKRIILPPLLMSTGAFMFVFPPFRLPVIEGIEAILVGVIFSFFLIKYSKFEIKNHEIYLIPSKSFIFILFGLLLIRITIKLIIGSQITIGETSSLFFLLGFGMIFTWRLAMLVEYFKLKKLLHD